MSKWLLVMLAAVVLGLSYDLYAYHQVDTSWEQELKCLDHAESQGTVLGWRIHVMKYGYGDYGLRCLYAIEGDDGFDRTVLIGAEVE